MSHLFITGFSGNVGSAVARYLDTKDISYIAGVRHLEKYTSSHPKVTFRHFDLEDKSTYATALQGIEKIFLVRPPQISNVDKVFKPFIEYCKSINIKHIVFLSLLGVEKNPFPPHHKIEKLILKANLPYTFIRPSFFMQNLVVPHGKEIRENNEIFIPSGHAKISFIDTDDIGEIIGKVLQETTHLYKSYTLTGFEAIDYNYVATVMSQILQRKITYANPTLLNFRKTVIQQGTPKAFANVMTVLYLTTKLGMAKKVTNTAEELLGRKPHSIIDFIQQHRKIWE